MMRRYLSIAIFMSGLMIPAKAQLLPNLGGQRTGISNLQFLKIGVGARGAALGDAMVALANDASASYWNPAGLTLNASNSVLISHTEWLAGLKHDFAGVVYHVSPDDILSLSVISLASDDMEITTETNPSGTGMYFSYSDVAFGISYGRKMTSQFSFGTTIRYVQENLDVLKMKAVLFDLDGTLLDTSEDIGDSVNRVLARHGYPTHSIDAYRTFIGDGAVSGCIQQGDDVVSA